MKKTITLVLIMMSLFSVCMGQTPASIGCTYTGSSGTEITDGMYTAGANYVIMKDGATSAVIKKIDNGCTATTLFTITALDNIKDARINVKTGDNSIVAVVLTNQHVYVKTLSLSGSAYTETSGTFYDADPGNTFTSIISSRSINGLAFIATSTDGTTTTPIMGKVNYTGARDYPIAVHEPGGSYQKIISDNSFHYIFYSFAGTAYMEKRLNDNSTPMNIVNIYPIDITSTEITDLSQDDSSVIAMFNGTGQLIKKKIYKINGTYQDALIAHTTGSNANGDAAMYISPSLSMLQGEIVKHSTNDYGTVSISGGTSFMSGYNTFRTHALGDWYVGWSAYSPDNKIKFLVLQSSSLNRLDSVTLSDGSINKRNGEYQSTATSYAIYGVSDGKSKLWVLNIPYAATQVFTPHAQETFSFYPNPVTSTIYVQAQDIRRVTITDMSGKTVEDCCAYEMDLSSLAAGIYLIHYGNITEKFIKK